MEGDRMNYLEALKLMEDGKIIKVKDEINETTEYRIINEEIEVRFNDGEWRKSIVFLKDFKKKNFEPVDEYALTFKEALEKLLNGDTVENYATENKFYFEKGILYEYDKEYNRIFVPQIEDCEISTRWKVIE